MTVIGHVTRNSEPKKPTRYFSKKQETQIAESVNGNRNVNSGATPFQKGDVQTDDWLIEAKTKTTDSASMSIKKEWIEKNKEEALFMGKPYSCVAFNFGPDQPNYYIIDEAMFITLKEYLANNKE